MNTLAAQTHLKTRTIPVLFCVVLIALMTACSSGSSSPQLPLVAPNDPTATNPGDTPTVNAPLVEPTVMQFTPPVGQTQDIFELMSAMGTFTRLLALIEKTDLQQTLQGPVPLTVFAPSDDAFAELDAAVSPGLLAALDTEQLRDRLTYHVLLGSAQNSTALRQYDNRALNMANNLPVAININNSGNLLLNSSVLSGPDIAASNGLLHVIDTVLTPPLRTIDPNNAVPPPSTDSISETLLERSDYSTLLSLVEQAGLAELLQGDNNGLGWTLFAPSDIAFERSSSDVFALGSDGDSMGAAELVNLHLFPGTIATDELVAGELNMRMGSVQVEPSANGFRVGGANIVGRDRVVANGIIHFVDAPLEQLMPN